MDVGKSRGTEIGKLRLIVKLRLPGSGGSKFVGLVIGTSADVAF